MNKELKALEIVAGYVPLNDREHLNARMPLRMVELFYNEIMTIKKALTPPTADEICDALSEEIHKKVLYNKDLEEFYYIKDISWRTNEEIMVCAMDFDKEKIVYYNSFGSKSTFLKPKTNILVGRFYEELERKENE